MTTNEEFQLFFPSTKNTEIGTPWTSPLSTRFKGLVSAGTESIAQHRYGYRNDTVTGAPVIGASLALQATSYVKRVKLESYVGSVSLASYDTWLRVYREVWAPSRDPRYQEYVKKKSYLTQVPNPFLPSKRNLEFVEVSSQEGQGSIPNDAYANQFGQYVLLWLRWDGLGADGKATPYGALIDWYWTGYDDKRRVLVPLDQKPTNGYSKSRSASFSTTGLNSYSAFGISGLYLVDYTPQGGESTARFFLRDNSLDPIPVIQSSRSSSVKINTLDAYNSRMRVSYGGSSIGLWGQAARGTLVPTNAEPYQELNTSTLATAGYEFSELVLKKDNKNYSIVVDPVTNDKIKIHREKVAGNISEVNLSKTGGKSIISSGSNQNYVEPNINFGLTPGPASIWEVQAYQTDNPLPLVVVDGTNLDVPVANLYDEDIKWISGYAPLADTPEGRASARANYYYVLPSQKRSLTGTSCLCEESLESNPTTAFTSPSNTCTLTRHFGKFLKYEVNSSRGFTTGQLQEWVGSIKTLAKQSMSDALVGTKFSGYYFTGFGAVPTPITFTLADVDGFKGGARQKFPSATSVRSGNTADRIEFNTGETSSNESNLPSASIGPPIDWKKKITDAMSKLVQGSAVNKLTPQRLSRVLSGTLSEGAPLSVVKEIALKSILDAKLAALQATTSKNRKQALKELEDDPLYQSLVGAINTLKRLPKTGGTDTGSTDSSNSGNQEKTIRISVFRGLPGTRGNTKPTASVEGRPELVQTFSVSTDDADTGTPKFRNFVFPFVPREVNYSGIGTQWTEIPRSGNYPIVDWTGFNLLKISFNFDIVNTNYTNKQGFGLSYSCEDQITRLREMAQTPYPVTFLNMDKFMQNEVRWPLLTSGRGIEFVIAEFSVTAVQRTGGGGPEDKSVPNQISRATCSMTLQEIPIEAVEIVQMPKIVPCKKNCGGDIPTKEQTKQYLLFMAGKASV